MISHFPYNFFRSGRWPVSASGIQLSPTSVIYTLFVALISLICLNNDRLGPIAKASLLFSLCLAAMPGDGGYFLVLCVLAFGAYRGDFKRQASTYAAIVFFTLLFSRGIFAPYQLGMFLVIPLLRQYNGTLGGSKHSKWFFYVFYPLHLLVIGLLKYGV